MSVCLKPSQAQAGILKALVRSLQKDTMRRVHGLCLFWCDAEEWSIKHLEVLLQEVGMPVATGD
jgi:hypothetical protein